MRRLLKKSPRYVLHFPNPSSLSQDGVWGREETQLSEQSRLFLWRFSVHLQLSEMQLGVNSRGLCPCEAEQSPAGPGRCQSSGRAGPRGGTREVAMSPPAPELGTGTRGDTGEVWGPPGPGEEGKCWSKPKLGCYFSPAQGDFSAGKCRALVGANRCDPILPLEKLCSAFI